ncbi:hypothetical protein Q5M85_09005 [Paraclostridium bifermentans]|nr:hypothetical protein [Paraclostridium bifermentans]
MDYTNDVIYENIRPNMKTYSPIIFMPTNSGLQRLSKNLDTDPVPVQG